MMVSHVVMLFLSFCCLSYMCGTISLEIMLQCLLLVFDGEIKLGQNAILSLY